MIAVMKRLGYEHRLPSRSVAAVKQAYEDAFTRLQRSTPVPFGNRRTFTGEAFTNAIVLHFLSLPESEQQEAIRSFVPVFDRMANAPDGDGPAPIVAETRRLPGKNN